MNAPLRVNEALLIADRAFKPFQCIAWAPQENDRELNLTVIDRTSSRLLDRRCIHSDRLRDPQQLEAFLLQARQSLCDEGFSLEPWHMPQ